MKDDAAQAAAASASAVGVGVGGADTAVVDESAEPSGKPPTKRFRMTKKQKLALTAAAAAAAAAGGDGVGNEPSIVEGSQPVPVTQDEFLVQGQGQVVDMDVEDDDENVPVTSIFGINRHPTDHIDDKTKVESDVEKGKPKTKKDKSATVAAANVAVGGEVGGSGLTVIAAASSTDTAVTTQPSPPLPPAVEKKRPKTKKEKEKSGIGSSSSSGVSAGTDSSDTERPNPNGGFIASMASTTTTTPVLVAPIGRIMPPIPATPTGKLSVGDARQAYLQSAWELLRDSRASARFTELTLYLSETLGILDAQSLEYLNSDIDSSEVVAILAYLKPIPRLKLKDLLMRYHQA